MGRRARRRLRRLDAELARRRPDLDRPGPLIAGGAVRVDGRVVTNPASLVSVDAALVVRLPRPLRGEPKLRAGLAAFRVALNDRVALDVGAAAGGFTRVLLEAGARRVYAVDAGHGQLVGSLRQHERVVNLEGVNLGELSRELVPESVDVVTFDLSYLAVARAVAQLAPLDVSPDADLVALVKPTFELGLASPPADPALGVLAVALAERGMRRAGWEPRGAIESPVSGARGAAEWLVHARGSQ